jgi:hypothetical protein
LGNTEREGAKTGRREGFFRIVFLIGFGVLINMYYLCGQIGGVNFDAEDIQVAQTGRVGPAEGKVMTKAIGAPSAVPAL